MSTPAPGPESLGPVAIVDDCPAYHRGLSGALVEVGFAVVMPEDPWAWVRGTQGIRALLVTIASEGATSHMATLSSVADGVIPVALLPEPSSASAYRAALRNGAHGAVPRDAPLDEIIEAVRAAFRGRVVIPAGVAKALATAGAVEPPALSGQQIEWIRDLACGETVSGIGRRSGYSERAMHRHLRDLYCSLGATNRTQALVRAVEYGLTRGTCGAPNPDVASSR